MNVKTRPLAEITRDAIQILARELGVDETARFLSQYGGSGNYTEERHDYFEGMTLDDMVSEIRKLEAKRATPAE